MLPSYSHNDISSFLTKALLSILLTAVVENGEGLKNVGKKLRIGILTRYKKEIMTDWQNNNGRDS